MSMKKLLFVYNPRSGKGLIKQNLFEIINIFTENGYEVTAYPTQRGLDCHDRILEEAEEYDLLVVSGGDGTLSEAVQAIMEGGLTVPLGYIPAGSTNDFAMSMGIPRGMTKAARDIANGVIFENDCGCFNGRYFSYVAAFGMFTDVTYETPQTTKNILGHAAYVLEGLRRLPSYKGIELTVEHDGITETGNFILGLISNSRSVGGMAIKALGRSNFDDGLLEISMVRTPTNPIVLQQTINEILANRIGNDHFLVFSASNVKITSAEGVSWTLDGEAGGTHTEVSITCCKRAIKLMIRPDDKTDQQNEIDHMRESLKISKSLLFEDQAGIEK